MLSAGQTPRTSLERWDFSIYGEVAEDLKWTWDEFRKLPRETITVDIHCVTKWSKLDTVWRGVSGDRCEVVQPGEELPESSDLLTEATLPIEKRGTQRRYTQLGRFNIFLASYGSTH